MIKKNVQNLISWVHTSRIKNTNSVTIKKKVSYLKRNKRYKPFPFDKQEVTIKKFFPLSKSDKLYFDFFYSVNNIASPDYIPLGLYYSFIEPVLNNRLLTAAIKDKNFYQLFMKDIPAPKTITRKINGIYYNEDFQQIVPDDEFISELNKNYDKLILKPSVESGAGKSIYLFQKKNNFLSDNNVKLSSVFFSSYKPDFIIQEFVNQHPYFKKFNPSSNNTIRIFTYRSVKNDCINVLHTLLRIGKEGSYLDHDNFGGVAISIKGNFHFNECSYTIDGDKKTIYNDISFKDEGKVPYISEIQNLAKQIAGKIFYARLLAMDFTIDENGKPLLLEINCWNNGVSQYQMNNGSLFNEFTLEILEYCKSVGKKKKILII